MLDHEHGYCAPSLTQINTRSHGSLPRTAWSWSRCRGGRPWEAAGNPAGARLDKCGLSFNVQTDEPSHSRGAIFRPGFAIRCPSRVRGRREHRALNRTRNPRGLKRKMPTSRQARPISRGTPCAMALRLTSRSRRSTGLVSLRRPGCSTRGLIPASGDHDHATSPYAPISLACETDSVHRSPRNVSWRS
jgi:hypothetical protein